MALSALRSLLTGKTMKPGQYETVIHCAERKVGDVIVTEDGHEFRCLAVGPKHERYGQMVLMEAVKTKRRKKC